MSDAGRLGLDLRDTLAHPFQIGFEEFPRFLLRNRGARVGTRFRYRRAQKVAFMGITFAHLVSPSGITREL
jgi:hypothetical protein